MYLSDIYKLYISSCGYFAMNFQLTFSALLVRITMHLWKCCSWQQMGRKEQRKSESAAVFLVFSTFFLQHVNHQAYHQSHQRRVWIPSFNYCVWRCLKDWVDGPHSFSPVKQRNRFIDFGWYRVRDRVVCYHISLSEGLLKDLFLPDDLICRMHTP